MTYQQQTEFEKSLNIRAMTTKQIWSYATGMLAICMIFAPGRYKLAIPMIVIGGAATSTAFVWHSHNKSDKTLLPNQVQQIEERLGNIETIVGRDDLEVNLKLKQLEEKI
ncbi:MAG: hypothetical protein F6K55_12220 [Moorea sp. SIO4A3]|nr:hypothetical protein [Moorena sp. SIO4A3]